MHRTIIENAHDVSTLAKAAAKVGDQHLPDGRFVTDQLHQLIDTILFQQVFCALLLECQPGIEECQARAFSSPYFGFPC